MYEEDKIDRFAELEARANADETDWESFFQAAELWEEIRSNGPVAANWDDEEWWEFLRRINRRVAEYQEEMKPGFWKRLHAKITKRG